MFKLQLYVRIARPGMDVVAASCVSHSLFPIRFHFWDSSHPRKRGKTVFCPHTEKVILRDEAGRE